jgi:hypothetical protein
MPSPSSGATPGWFSTALRELVHGPARFGYVAAVGSRASYLAFDSADPGVVCLVDATAVRLPIAIQLQALPALVVGQTLRIGDGRLDIDAWSCQPGRWWDPRPRLDASTLRGSGDVLQRLLRSFSTASFGLPPEDATEAISRLAEAHPAAAVALLGRGPGFTPAGDDVVAGALAALALTHRLAPRGRDTLLEAASDLTTTVSAALLRCAARGQVIPQAGRVLEALSKPHQPALEAAVDALSVVGATSGRALTLGIGAALAAVRNPEMEST